MSNIRDFAQLQGTQILDVWYSSTYLSLYSLLQSDSFPMGLIIGSHNVDLLLIVLPLLQHGTQALVLLAMLATWWRPEAVPYYRVANLGILMALVTTEAGGYSQIYFMLFAFMEPWRGIGRRWAIVACYALALPLDIPIGLTPSLPHYSYLAGTDVWVAIPVNLGPFLRPLIIMTVAHSLALVTIREVWADIRQQGWAQRWRFRHDAPLLPWIRRPAAPGSSAAPL